MKFSPPFPLDPMMSTSFLISGTPHTNNNGNNNVATSENSQVLTEQHQIPYIDESSSLPTQDKGCSNRNWWYMSSLFASLSPLSWFLKIVSSSWLRLIVLSFNAYTPSSLIPRNIQYLLHQQQEEHQLQQRFLHELEEILSEEEGVAGLWVNQYAGRDF